VVVGCTEFPLVLESVATHVPVIDPAQIGARCLPRVGKGEEEV